MKKISIMSEQMQILATLSKGKCLSVTQYLNSLILELSPNVATGTKNDTAHSN